MRADHATPCSAGAKHVFNPTTDDIVQRSHEASPDGWGPAVVFECAGVQRSMDAALNSVRGQGTIVNIGIFESDITFNPNIINRRSLKYVGSNIYTRDEFREVVDAIADGEFHHSLVLISSKRIYRPTMLHSSFDYRIPNKQIVLQVGFRSQNA